MNPIDGAGNILQKKDSCVIHINAVVKAEVMEIKEASTLMAKPGEFVPGYITFYVPITVPFTPFDCRIKDVFKIVKPPNWDKAVPPNTHG